MEKIFENNKEFLIKK